MAKGICGIVMKEIKMVSLMASNADFFYRRLADYLTLRTGIKVSVMDEIDWRDREHLLDSGQAQIGFVCGLQYVQKVDDRKLGLELLAAPIMKSARYLGKPIYFSDVVVHRYSPFQSMSDLRGNSWACNEPTSHSGCNLIRYYLATQGECGNFFQEVVESGSHQNSLALLLDGKIDATAIDSTVLELELHMRPELSQYIRIIETLGPSPIPPCVVSAMVRQDIILALRQTLLTMHSEPEGLELLASLSLSRFEQVYDSDYNLIRSMDEKARQTRFALSPPANHTVYGAQENLLTI
jgi:phosphonate transport system substrate-binding protein